MNRTFMAILTVAAALARTGTAQELTATITVQGGAPAISVSPLLYGVFYEDINYSADGGLYAEMVQNRSFEYRPIPRGRVKYDVERAAAMEPLSAWQSVQRGGLSCQVTTGGESPVHPNNPTYAVLTLSDEALTLVGEAGKGPAAGFANSGYDGGMPVTEGALYDVALHARCPSGSIGALRVALETADGTELAATTLPAPGAGWGKLAGELKASRSEPKARLVITAAKAGVVHLDMVSLFPRDTFKGRKNGLRKDLARAIADLKPQTFRFPGGCIVHGNGLANAYRWKDTVGDIAERKTNFNRWGYYQSYGLGYFEYFQFCEDIGAAPLPILPVGVSCGFVQPYETVSGDALQPWIQDVLDLVEFANGPVDSPWGKVRAAMGHPAPFNLVYVGLGNEEHDKPEFRAVFPKFVEALRAKHPEIKIVGTSGLSPSIPLFRFMKENKVEISDEHYYMDPPWFIANHRRFDKVPRGEPRVIVGEYASKGNAQFNAVAEAVYLTGIERNADQVVMTAYAPLLARYDYTQWTRANLIWFDATRLVKTPSYHVQHMFGTNQGDQGLKHEVAVAGDEKAVVGVSAQRVSADGTVILKFANPQEKPVKARVELAGFGRLGGRGTVITLAGAKNAVNDRRNPDAVAPVMSEIPVGASFTCELPAMSVQVLRIPAAR